MRVDSNKIFFLGLLVETVLGDRLSYDNLCPKDSRDEVCEKFLFCLRSVCA